MKKIKKGGGNIRKGEGGAFKRCWQPRRSPLGKTEKEGKREQGQTGGVDTFSGAEGLGGGRRVKWNGENRACGSAPAPVKGGQRGGGEGTGGG